MFRTVPLSIIRSFSLHTHSNGICHTGLLTACEQDRDAVLILLIASCQQTCMILPLLCVCSEKLLMMDRGTVRNMWSFIPKINLRNYCI